MKMGTDGHRWPGVHGWEGGSREWVMQVRVKATPRPKTLDPRSRHSGYCPDSSVVQKPSLSLSLKPSINRQSTVSTSQSQPKNEGQAGRKGKKKHTCIKKIRTTDTEGSRIQTPPKARQNNEKGSLFFTAICFTLYPGLPASESDSELRVRCKQNSKQQAANIRRSIRACAFPQVIHTCLLLESKPVVPVSSQLHHTSRRAPPASQPAH